MASRILEKIDHFAQFVLGLIDPRNVSEGDLGIRFCVNLGLALADGHETTHALAGHWTNHKHPDQQKAKGRQKPPQQGHQKTWRRLAGER